MAASLKDRPVHQNSGLKATTKRRFKNVCMGGAIVSLSFLDRIAAKELRNAHATFENTSNAFILNPKPYETSQQSHGESRTVEPFIEPMKLHDSKLLRSSERHRTDTAQHIQPTLTSVLGLTKARLDFDYLVVIDFESTCDQRIGLTPQEIIEFPAVLVNLATRRVEAVFRTFVRPVCHPRLTEFCTSFTGIQQDQVDRAVLLGEALEMHDAWLEDNGVKGKRFVVATWSDWDCKVMLESECKWKGLQKPPYFNRWINLKVPFRQKYGNVRTNLRGSVELTGRKWEGRQHSGLDDATNTAYLALELVRQGVRLQVTNSFKIYAPDGSKIALPMLTKRPRPAAAKNLDDAGACGHLDEATLLCYCGVPSCERAVKKPGLSHGRHFFSCGKWTITAGGKCTFFVWAPSSWPFPSKKPRAI